MIWKNVYRMEPIYLYVSTMASFAYNRIFILTIQINADSAAAAVIDVEI